MPRFHYESHEDRSGKNVEHFLMGDVTKGRNSLRYEEALKRVTERLHRTQNLSYLPFRDALGLTKEVQEGDPIAPKKRFMRDIREAVARKLGLDDEAARNVGIYSAVGTPLDGYHGVDAFIEWKNTKGESKIATLDVTVNQEKLAENRAKADVLIGEVPDPEENLKSYHALIDHIAEQAVLRLKSSR